MKKFLALLLVCLSIHFAFSQTLVNQILHSTFGQPNQQLEYVKAIPLGGNTAAVLDNNYSSIPGTDNESMHVAKYSLDSGVIAAMDLYFLHGRDFGTNLYSKNGLLYVTGFSTDSLFSHSLQCNLAVIDVSSFDTIFTTAVQIDSATNQMPFGVAADDSGYIYMGAAVSTPTSYKISLLKLSPTGSPIWQTDYDSAGYYNIPVAMNLVEDITSASFNVTGFSFDNGGHSHFVTISVNPRNGHIKARSYADNGVGMISHPVGIVSDTAKQSYVAGTSTVAGLTSVIKLVKYDSLFNEIWATTWGDSTKSNTAAFMGMDQPLTIGHVYVTGSTPNASGGTDIVTLRFNPDGTLSWERKLPVANPLCASVGVGLTINQMGSVYVTGTTYNGSDTDIVTAGYDTAGNLLWSKTYNRIAGSNDVPYSILISDDSYNVMVYGRSIGRDSVYMALKYKQSETVIPNDTLAPVQQWAYYENLGQLIDTGIHQADYLHFYTNTSNPRVYLSDNALSYVYDHRDSIVDSLQRIDLIFHQAEWSGSKPVNSSPTFFASEQIQSHLNYYIGGLPSFYENVHGYQRITEKNLYSGIDWQLYSDAGGTKYYYVVMPGTDPANIEFEYQGADSTYADSTLLHIISRFGELNSSVSAYQGTTPISISIGSLGSSYFYFNLGTYDLSQPLAIMVSQQPAPARTQATGNLAWSTYLGGSGDDWAKDIDIDNNHQQFITGNTASPNFPTTAGTPFLDSAATAGCFFTKFDNASVLQYSSFYGGSIRQPGSSIGTNSNAVAAGIWTQNDGLNQTVYIAGQTNCTNLPCPKYVPLGSSLNDTSYNGGVADGFIALFNGYNGALRQASYVGSDGEDGINTLEIDRDRTHNPNALFAGGYTTGSNFPFQNTLSGNFYTNQGCGVLMQLDPNMKALCTTGFGSPNLYHKSNGDSAGCSINDVKLDNAGNPLIVGTSWFSFPTASPYNITQPSGAFTLSSHPSVTYQPPSNAFLAKFTPVSGSTNKYQLYYFSEFGDDEPSRGEKICANSNNDIYIAGFGQCNYLSSDTSFDYIDTLLGSDGGLVVKFNQNGRLLAIGDYGGDNNIAFGDMFCDDNDNVFIYGTDGQSSPNFSLRQRSGWFYDAITSTKSFLACITPSNTMNWSTLFGGQRGKEYMGGMCIDGNGLFICGKTTTSDNAASPSPILDFPLMDNHVSTFFPQFGGGGASGGGDAYVARFTLLDYHPLGLEAVQNYTSKIKCYPNPSNGHFIVAFEDFDSGDKTVTLYNYLGQSLYTDHTSDNRIEINGAERLSIGIYLVEVQSNNKRVATKIVISGQ